MRDLYSNDVETAARLARDEGEPEAEQERYQDAEQDARNWRVPALRNFCAYCDAAITQAEDGAWEDSSGACGCGDDEHAPAIQREDFLPEHLDDNDYPF